MITLCNTDNIDEEEKKAKLNRLAQELEENKNKLKMINPNSEGVKQKSDESNENANQNKEENESNPAVIDKDKMIDNKFENVKGSIEFL